MLVLVLVLVPVRVPELVPVLVLVPLLVLVPVLLVQRVTALVLVISSVSVLIFGIVLLFEEAIQFPACPSYQKGLKRCIGLVRFIAMENCGVGILIYTVNIIIIEIAPSIPFQKQLRAGEKKIKFNFQEMFQKIYFKI